MEFCFFLKMKIKKWIRMNAHIVITWNNQTITTPSFLIRWSESLSLVWKTVDQYLFTKHYAPFSIRKLGPCFFYKSALKLCSTSHNIMTNCPAFFVTEMLDLDLLIQRGHQSLFQLFLSSFTHPVIKYNPWVPRSRVSPQIVSLRQDEER